MTTQNNNQQIANESFRSSIDELLATSKYADLELPENFGDQIFELAWKHRGTPADKLNKPLSKQITRVIDNAFPAEGE
jgi:hypothetical protein